MENKKGAKQNNESKNWFFGNKMDRLTLSQSYFLKKRKRQNIDK